MRGSLVVDACGSRHVVPITHKIFSTSYGKKDLLTIFL